MPAPLVYHHTPPALMPLYGKALLPKAGNRKLQDIQIPPLEAHLLGVATHTPELTDYRTVCDFPQGSRLPITWPHILAFPLHLKLLTETAFPLPLLGLVHLRNSITQHRPLACGENLDLRVIIDHSRHTDRGLEFDLITEARAAGRLVWEETSTNLFREAAPGKSGAKPRPAIETLPFSEEIPAPENLGRRYAKVSGDRNPIHLHALSARAFGFPRAIAHGMWSKARSLATLEKQADWKDGPVRASCQFKKPLLLPGSALLNWRTGGESWDYQLLNTKGNAPYLTGRIEWL
ncbi:MaoC family dehydratase [Marinobacter sp. VGCF2001]|uniref:MaoC family dehydratase n=1 Tax=Marinobacter sp. VGCF2001 TaxID=3417189 RepID=UPI003CF71932